MHDLDETDLEILSLLAENARRPFSDIGEAVGLSGPAVSDRVQRLQETGVLNRFTVDIDRSVLRAGVPVLVRLAVPSGSVDAVRERVGESDGVEHVFVTVEGEIWCYARVGADGVRAWVSRLLGDVDADYTVTLVEEADWTPSVEGVEFALTCAECGNTVDEEGETARIDGEVYHFCCPSCLARFEDRYREIEEGV